MSKVNSGLTITMGMTQAKPVERPQIEVGMIDERLNETVTYVAEMDVSAAQEDVRQLRRGLCPIICLLLPLSLGFPCVLLCTIEHRGNTFSLESHKLRLTLPTLRSCSYRPISR